MNKIAIFLIKKYQQYSINKGRKHCKYYPTCSSYALKSFMKFSFIKASLLTIFRILRCNPFSKGGYDPVPLCYTEKIMNRIFVDLFKK